MTLNNDPNTSVVSDSLGTIKHNDSIFDRSQSIMQPTDTSMISMMPQRTVVLPPKLGIKQVHTISYDGSGEKSFN